VPWAQRNNIGLWFKPWFFKHVETFLSRDADAENVVEYIPLREYYHRHTKAIFWELEQIIPVGNHPVFRWLLGWAVPPKVSFLKLTQTEAIKELYETQHVIQDMLVPISKMEEALTVFEEHYGIYPLWLCPYRAYDYTDKKAGVPHRCFLRRPLAAEMKDEEVEGQPPQNAYEMYVDIGAYGIPRQVLEKQPFDAVGTAQKVESYVASVHGFQMLYADSYLTRDEFRDMFDHEHYDLMKARYDTHGAFPEVYEKTCKKALKLWGATGGEDSEEKKRQ
jgi:delta24-sterol reductase